MGGGGEGCGSGVSVDGGGGEGGGSGVSVDGDGGEGGGSGASVEGGGGEGGGSGGEGCEPTPGRCGCGGSCGRTDAAQAPLRSQRNMQSLVG